MTGTAAAAARLALRASLALCLGGALSAAAPPSAAACSGGPLLGGLPGEPRTYEEAAEVIFTGTAVRVEDRFPGPTISSLDPLLWTFVVDSVEKGTVGDRFTVASARLDASCGYPFELGHRYRVLAWEVGEEGDSFGHPEVLGGNGTEPMAELAVPPPVEGAIGPPFSLWAVVSDPTLWVGLAALAGVTFLLFVAARALYRRWTTADSP